MFHSHLEVTPNSPRWMKKQILEPRILEPRILELPTGENYLRRGWKQNYLRCNGSLENGSAANDALIAILGHFVLMDIAPLCVFVTIRSQCPKRSLERTIFFPAFLPRFSPFHWISILRCERCLLDSIETYCPLVARRVTPGIGGSHRTSRLFGRTRPYLIGEQRSRGFRGRRPYQEIVFPQDIALFDR